MADKIMEYIAGGEAEGMTPEDIAKKQGVDVSIVNDQIKLGVSIEVEHTPDKNVAAEIAKDHLVESPFYYDYLVDMEEELEENLEEDIKEGKSEVKREEEEEKKPMKKASVANVIEFLKKNPNPKDEDVHAWAEENGYEIHSLEAIFYKLASDHVKMMEKEDSLQDYLDAAKKKEEEKKKNGEKKKKEGEEEEEEEDPKKKKKKEGKKKKEEDDEEEKKKKSSKKEKKDSDETKEDIINRLFG